MKPTLHIIRGLPGSGKSTYALQELPKSLHFEADRFFTNEKSEYNFNARLLSVAHSWCHANVVRALINGHNAAVSNTFTKLWEIQKYIDLIHEYDLDIDIKIVEMKTQYQNIHNVPQDKLDLMHNRWEELPTDFAFEVIRITE